MTPRQRKPWSKVVDESGISVRVYERASGSLLYREVRVGGEKDRKSLGHRDRSLAEQQARELAQRLAELRLIGHTGSVTLGQLVRLYQQHRIPLFEPGRARRARDCIRHFTAHLGDRFVVTDLSQSHVDTYTAARRRGAIGNPRRAAEVRGVRDSTILNDLLWLGSLFNFACGYKVGGRPLLLSNPMRGLALPKERNIRRPVASEERFRKTLAKADEADPTGRLACVLSLARYTGRRITAICHLQASDILLSLDAMVRALAAMGQDRALAELPIVEHAGFHSYRRLYAVERKHLPDVDVARSAGWRDLATMKRSYQQPDPVTTLRVVENSPESGSGGHTSDTPQQATDGCSTA